MHLVTGLFNHILILIFRKVSKIRFIYLHHNNTELKKVYTSADHTRCVWGHVCGEQRVQRLCMRVVEWRGGGGTGTMCSFQNTSEVKCQFPSKMAEQKDRPIGKGPSHALHLVPTRFQTEAAQNWESQQPQVTVYSHNCAHKYETDGSSGMWD